jgi:hypothetical protein
MVGEMKPPNKRSGVDAGRASLFAFSRPWPGATHRERSARVGNTANDSMKRNLSYLSAAVFLFAAITTSTSAGTFLTRFEVTNLGSSNGNPPPTDPVTGTIMWESTGIHDPILSIDSIDMTIAGHPYSIGEITYLSSANDWWVLVGGSPSGDNMQDQTDDFWIRWNRFALLPYDFAYTSSTTSGTWYSAGWPTLDPSAFSVSEIPEPSTTAICGLFVFLATVFGISAPKRYEQLHAEPSGLSQ